MSELEVRSEAPVQDVARNGVYVPEQSRKPVKDAYDTAKKLGGILATFNETIRDLRALKNASDSYVFNYMLAVNPKGLPREAGCYRVERTDEVKYIPISKDEAEILIFNGRLYDVLYVTETAVNAAKEGRPIALGFKFRFQWIQGISVNDLPDEDAQVALSRQVVPQANAAQAELLRKAWKQLGKINEIARTDMTDAIEEVLRRAA